jgi:hypothetical protein
MSTIHDRDASRGTLETKLGLVSIYVGRRDYIRVSAGSRDDANQNGIAVYGVPLNLNLYLHRQPDGSFGMNDDHDLNASRPHGYRDASRAAQHKIREVLIPAVNEWAHQHPEALIAGERRHLQFEIQRAETRAGELREHLEVEVQDLANLRAELAKLPEPVSALIAGD